MILTGCQSTEKRLSEAATRQGYVRAAVILPELPQPCRNEMDLVVPRENEKWRHVQIRWEVVRGNENEIKAACATFYDNLRTRLATVN